MEIQEIQYSDLEKAYSFAEMSHRGQFRNGPQKTPYIEHPYRVGCASLMKFPDDIEMAIAGYLHDVVEDTPVTIEDIKNNFGEGVAKLVAEMTNVTQDSGLPRAEKARIERKRISGISGRGKTLKCLDSLDNLSDIMNLDINFAKIYVLEKELLLKESLVGADEGVYKILENRIQELKKDLGLAS
jgi:(p)ppGpp synthase/HD superfamily hydrolase